MVGIHDYIVLNPKKVNPYRHGFRLYNEKIYAYIDISDRLQVLKQIESATKKNFKNFYLVTHEIRENELKKLLQNITAHYPDSKLVVQTDIKEISAIYPYVKAIATKEKLVNISSVEKKASHFNVDVIWIRTFKSALVQPLYADIENAKKDVLKFSKYDHIIVFYTTNDYDIYGVSNKNALKREILALVDLNKADAIVQPVHQYGAIALEHYGYIEKMHDINIGLPDLKEMLHYKGVLIWLYGDYPYPDKLFEWVIQLNKIGIKTLFLDNFGSNIDQMLLGQLGIDLSEAKGFVTQRKIIYKDPMIGFETAPILGGGDSLYLIPHNAKPLIQIQDNFGDVSVPAAITEWGGYALRESFIFEFEDQNIWIINPFLFFKEGLRLEKLPAPDTTTENGRRYLFSHIDGDGIMNTVEFDPDLVSGDTIYRDILSRYDIPISVSVIGAEIMPNGLYPKLSPRLLKLTKKIFRLPNIEGATHTFTHTFFWGEITKDGDLSPKYRLKPKGYDYNLTYEIKGMLDYIMEDLYPKGKKPIASSVFWSGDCSPRKNALEVVYKNNLLNINGGYTTITYAQPYLTNVAPLGLERGGYYQIYTGEQNENVFTNDWIGPFWGFKKVVQTFKLTDKPRRLKPIDIYYHFYSGSKRASLNALKYVYDYAIKQDVFPIFTSEFVKKVMDYFEISIANEGDSYLVSGTKNLRTLKFCDDDVGYTDTKTLLGKRKINNDTYFSLAPKSTHTFSLQKEMPNIPYVISANGAVKHYIKGNYTTRIEWSGHVDLSLMLHIPKGCKVDTVPKPSSFKQIDDTTVSFQFTTHKAITDVSCK